MSQHVRVILISGSSDDAPSEQGKEVKEMFEDKKLQVEVRALTLSDNAVHREFYNKAKKLGYEPDPLICTENESGELMFEGAGKSAMTLLLLSAREYDLTHSRHKELSSA